MIMETATVQRIRELNDAARRTLTGCRVLMSPGIMALGDTGAIIRKVQLFDAFTQDNDPYGEHDFGVVTHNGATLFWKFDYYDLDLTMCSADASDPSVTARVLTIMLAEEY